jgi:signal transduction histidine kinase
MDILATSSQTPSWDDFINWSTRITSKEIDAIISMSQNPFKDFVEALNPITILKENIEINPSEESKDKLTAFIYEIAKVRYIIEQFIHFLVTIENRDGYGEVAKHIHQIFTHDLWPDLNTISLRELCENEINQKILLNSFEFYLKQVRDFKKRVAYFFETLYFTMWLNIQEIELKKTEFNLNELVEYLFSNNKDSKIQIINDISTNTSYFWIEGDIFIFLLNIVKNSEKHGKATQVTFEVEWENLIIKDNGKGIDEEILPVIFQSGISWWESTGLWLRDVEKRWIEVTASNNGLRNNDWNFWARFEIKIQKRK